MNKTLEKQIKEILKYDPSAGGNKIAKQLGTTRDKIKRKLAEIKQSEWYKNLLNNDVKTQDVEIKESLLNQQVGFWKKKYNELLKTSAVEQSIIQHFKQSIDSYQETEYIREISTTNSEPSNEELVLMISDIHAGEEITSEEVLGLNEYNMDIMEERLNIVFNNLSSIRKKMSGYEYKKLNIFMLGDLCLLPESIIHMEDGTTKYIKDILPGDKILSRMGVGEVEKLTKTNLHKEKYKIHPVGMLPLEGSCNHIIPVISDDDIVKTFNKNNGGFWQRKKKYICVDNIKEKRLDEIVEGDYVLSNGIRGMHKSKILDISNYLGIDFENDGELFYEDVRGNKPKISNTQIELTDDLLWCFGLYLAEGNMLFSRERNVCGLNLTMNISEGHILDNFDRNIKNIFGEHINTSIKKNYESNTITYFLYSKIVGLIFQKACGEHSKNKKIDERIYNVNKSLIPLVCGWLDGDGTTSLKQNYISGKTTSRNLAFQIYNICMFENIANRINSYIPSNEKMCEAFTIFFNGKYANCIKKYSIRFKENEYRNGYEEGQWIGSYYARRVFKIHNESYDGDMYDITMKEDPYFQVNGIVSHNCSGMIHDELLQGTTVTDQVIILSEILSEMIKKWSRVYEEIDVCGVIGNHGRLTKKPYFKNKYNNFDYLCMKMIEARCENLENVVFQLPKSPFMIKQIFDKNFLLMHGDGIKGSMGIPFYGLKRMDSNMSQALVVGKDIYPSHICMGHFHTQNSMDKMGGKIIMGGSLKGTDPFCLGAMFVSGEPKQKCFSVHKENGVTWEMDINLS